MEFKRRTLNELADMICGNSPDKGTPFVYRSSGYITQFFADYGTDFVHDGSTRGRWVANRLAEILSEPRPYPNGPRRHRPGDQEPDVSRCCDE